MKENNSVSKKLVSVIYYPNPYKETVSELSDTELCIKEQSIGESKIELIKMPACAYKESLSTWQKVYPELNGKYVTIVHEGDHIEKDFFANMISDMKQENMKIAVPLRKNDISFNVIKIDNQNKKRRKIQPPPSVFDVEKGKNFFFSLNGALWRRNLFTVEEYIDLGWETEKYYILNMLLQEKKWMRVRKEYYYYIEPTDDNVRFFPGMTDIDWYISSMTDFLIPYLKNAREKYGEVPQLLQFYTLHFLRCRLYANSDNRNKHLIEDEEVDKYLELWHEVLEFVDKKVILMAESIRSLKLNFNIRRMLLQIKMWDFNFDFDILQNSKTLFLSYDNYLIMSMNKVVVNITLMDYMDGKFYVDFSMPSYFDNNRVRYYAEINDEQYDFEFDERYSLTKYFGKAAYKRFGGRVVIPVDPSLNNQKFTFYAEYNGVRQPLKMEFKSHTSRISGKPKYAYWNVSKYTLYSSKKSIVIRKRSAKYTLYRELKCLKEMFMGIGKKPILVLFLMRLAYWFTRPFYRKKTIWMFYDKLYKGGDSSEYLYKYAMKQNDGIKKYYVLDKHSADYRRMKNEGYKPVKRNSPRHFLIFLNAKMMIVSNSTVFAFHNFPLSHSAYIKGLTDFHVCCVQHGLSVQKIAIAQRRLRDNTRLYFCASKYEIDNLSQPQYNYEGQNALRLTGVPRYDGLVNEDKKQLLIAPTWRMQSALLVSRNEGVARDYNPNFKETEYYKIFNGLINNDRLIGAAKQYGYRIHYVLHPIVSPQADDFDKNDYVDIIPSIGDMSYEKEFRESSLMVTDYSGIQFDFAYMRKPLVYLHHYRIPQHYEEGTYHYDTMAFGEICRDENELIDLLIEYMKNDCKMKDEYRRRADDFFAYSDRNNCQRIYSDMIEYQHALDSSDNSCVYK